MMRLGCQCQCKLPMSFSTSLPELPDLGFLVGVKFSHREFLASFGEYVRVKNGEIVIEEGAAQNNLYLILSGMLHVVTTAGNRSLLKASE